MEMGKKEQSSTCHRDQHKALTSQQELTQHQHYRDWQLM